MLNQVGWKTNPKSNKLSNEELDQYKEKETWNII